MRKKNKILLGIGALFLIVIIVVGGLFVKSLKRDAKEREETISFIRDNYGVLEENIEKYNTYRALLLEDLDDFYSDDLLNRYEKMIESLKQIEKNIQDSKGTVKRIASRCQGQIFRDTKVNRICADVNTYYEKLVNLFVGDVNKVNDFISAYNDNHEKEVKEYSSEWKDYIDYDGDGKYSERDDG